MTIFNGKHVEQQVLYTSRNRKGSEHFPTFFSYRILGLTKYSKYFFSTFPWLIKFLNTKQASLTCKCAPACRQKVAVVFFSPVSFSINSFFLKCTICYHNTSKSFQMINENVISYDMSPTPDHGSQFLGSKIMGNNESVLWCTQSAQVFGSITKAEYHT